MQFTISINPPAGTKFTYTEIADAIQTSLDYNAQTGAVLEIGDSSEIWNPTGDVFGRWDVLPDAPAIDGVCTSDDELASERDLLSPSDRAKLDAIPSPADNSKAKRIPDNHKWLISRGWVRVEGLKIGGRIQARWIHARNGEQTFNTQMAEYNELRKDA